MARTAVVTGAAGGFGRAVVADLRAHGWDVVAVVRPGGTALPGGASGPGPASGSAGTGIGRLDVVPADVRDGAALAAGLGATLAGRPVDLVVAAAATGTPVRDHTVDADELLDVLDVNAAGPLRLVQVLLPHLLRAPDPLVLNVSSRLGSIADQASGRYRALRTSYPYRVSKAALNMLTACLALELEDRVRVWSVHPGTLATAMGQADAVTPPSEAAARLVALVASGDRRSPRFVTLDAPGGPDLPW